MSHPFAMTMTRPHEALGFHEPIGRRVPTGLAAWNVVVLSATIILAIGYVVRVNATAASSYQVRTAEQRVEELRTETMSMQDKLASLSSLQELTTKAVGNGYVPVDRIEFVNVNMGTFALRK